MCVLKPAFCTVSLITLVLTIGLHIGPLRAQQDESYPRKVSLAGGSVTIHHPTVSDWQDFVVLSAWVPVEVQAADSGEIWTGSVRIEADTAVRFEERIVSLSNLRMAEAKADVGLSADALALQQSTAASQLLAEALKKSRQSISLDYLLRALPADFAAGLVKPTPGVNRQPPAIIISERPAMLMLLDGPPRTAAIRDTELEIVVNTDWTVFHHRPSEKWYLVFGNYWLQNNSLSGGSWEVANALPADFERLVMTSGWEGLAGRLPPRQTDRIPPPFKLSYEPAELILFDGPLQLQQLAGTDLQIAANSDHDLFLFEGRYYLLLSGRWFSTRDLKRKWTSVELLPAVFAQIPPDSEQNYVLAAVPGTEESRIAIIEAALPRTQMVSQESGDGLQTSYDGEPQFVMISGTPLERATNTAKQVLRHNNFYYLCQDAAWYSASSATGPWKPALEIPDAIYSIPPDDPAYNVTFVKMGSFDRNSGRQAYIHTYGYSGTYTADTGLVHGIGPQGSGSYYDPTDNPLQRDHGYWPAYGPGAWPAYGYGARYYPTRGAWGYGGYYDPFWGYPYPYPMSDMSRPVTVDLPDDNSDWVRGEDGQQRPAESGPARNYIGSGTYQLNGQSGASEDPTAAGHIYSGPDGKLYRITEEGWQTQQGKKWIRLDEPVPSPVTREYQARLAGYASYQRYLNEQATQP